MKKLKITVLKRQNPNEVFDELPIKHQDWRVPCEVYKDGQEYTLEKLAMPKGFCGSAWHTIYLNACTIFY